VIFDTIQFTKKYYHKFIKRFLKPCSCA